MQWPERFYEWRSGRGCPMCEEGRPGATRHGLRFFAGEVCDAYLVRADKLLADVDALRRAVA